MCGICGVFSREQIKDAEGLTAVEKMSSLMKFRGPDAKGFWNDKKNCFLGFRRLSILDLSEAANQPMLTKDSRYALTYNGEIYNFKELREELKKEGVQFASTGDTEVVLYALVCWGPEALSRFNGMFALAFYDSLKGNLLLARDRAGVKPIYYMHVPSKGLVFASQYDQIISHPWSKQLGISNEALDLYLHLGYIPAPFAILKNTYMLEQGSWFLIDKNGEIKKNKFFEFPIRSEASLKGDDAMEVLDYVLNKAVKRHLVSDVEVGTFLSGGIDSPLITAKAYELSNHKIKAFTIGTNGDFFDESKDAQNYAREIGISQIIKNIDVNQAFDLVDDVISSCGEPFADYSIFPTLLISKIASKEVKVMLSGDGGDELFWGYYGRFSSILKQAKYFREPYAVRSVRWGLKKFFNVGSVSRNVRYSDIGSWYREKHSHISDRNLKNIFKENINYPKEFTHFDYNGFESDQTADWMRWNEMTVHLPRVLLKVDRASMFNSLEVRVPFLDNEVIEVASKVDWRSCLDLKEKTGKTLLRKVLKKHYQHQTLGKKGFGVPMNEWLKGGLRSKFEDTMFSRQSLLGRKMNIKNVREFFNNHLNNKSDYAWGLWILFSLALWEDKYLKN